MSTKLSELMNENAALSEALLEQRERAQNVAGKMEVEKKNYLEEREELLTIIRGKEDIGQSLEWIWIGIQAVKVLVSLVLIDSSFNYPFKYVESLELGLALVLLDISLYYLKRYKKKIQE
mgnify:CR=1 FL=1